MGQHGPVTQADVLTPYLSMTIPATTLLLSGGGAPTISMETSWGQYYRWKNRQFPIIQFLYLIDFIAIFFPYNIYVYATS